MRQASGARRLSLKDASVEGLVFPVGNSVVCWCEGAFSRQQSGNAFDRFASAIGCVVPGGSRPR